MRKHIYLMLIILMPIFAQKAKWKLAESKQIFVPEKSVSETNSTSVPRRISYQGFLTNENGQPANDMLYNIKFRLYRELEGGNHFWEESQMIFVKDGFLSATIGSSNEINEVPRTTYLEIEVGGSILDPRQEMTSVFYSVISDTSYFAKGYTKTEDLAPVAISGKYSDLINIPDTLSAELFIGSASGLTGILADSVGILSGNSPLVFEGEIYDNNQISLNIEEPSEDQEIVIPNVSGTIITTGNDELIDAVGIINSGVWMGDEIEDSFIDNDLNILGGVIDNTPIGDSIPSTGNFSSLTSQNGLFFDGGDNFLSNDELLLLDSALFGEASENKVLVTDSNNDISGLRNINASGVITADSFAGMFMGDGSGITGVSASSVGDLIGNSPLVFEGENSDDFQTTIQVEEPTSDQIIMIPNVTGTLLTNSNDSMIDAVGIVNEGTWQGSVIQDDYIANDLTIENGDINSTSIGMSSPDSGRFSSLESVNGITLGNGVINISPDEMSSIDGVIIGTALPNKVLIPNEDSSISGLNSLFIEENFFTAFATIDDILLDGATIGHTDDTDLVTLSNGTVTVAGTLAATTLTGDGSGITGVSASSLKSDDITEGDAAVTISTSTGAINLTPATGSAVVLDGSVNVDGGAVTGATTITASGAITGGSVTDGTATMSSGALSGVTTITGSGLATVGSLDVDDVLVDGATIGHTDDTDLVTLSNGTVTVAGTLAATTLTGDGSGITGVSANSLKSDDITEGDAAVTISTSTGAINLTPATGSAVVLDGSVNVDGGAVTGATTITASGAITGGSVTDGTATMSSGALSGVTTITGSGLATVGSLDVDDVLVDGATIGHTDDTDLVTLSDGTVTVAGEITATTLDIGGTNITATATEINVLDGGTSATSTTIVAADRIVLNDDGTMKQVAMSDVATYVGSISNLESLYDAKSGGTNFTESLLIGHETTGTLNASEYNTGVGRGSLDALTEGDNNTAIGYNSLSANTTGSDNIAIGYNALVANTTKGQNIAIGRDALKVQTDGGEFNVAVGTYSLDENIFGDKNVALGYVALGKNTEASYNTGIGTESLKLNTTGTNNTGLGYAAGDVVSTGSQNVLIGASTDPGAADATNQTVVGYGATGQADNSVTLGNADVTAVYMAQDKGATVYAAGFSLENDETVTNSTDGTVLINGTVASGTGSASGVFTSNGDNDLVLQTGNSTTGSITITDGADGNITLSPNGTGKTDFNDSPLTGFGADISSESGTSKTLAATDNGTIINCSSGSAVTITVPTSLPVGFNCMIIQSGSGQVTLSASSTTLNNRNGLKTAGQHAIMTLVHLGSNVFVVSGDTAS